MKGHHFLYSLGMLAVVSVLACFLVSATGTFPERFRKQQPLAETIPLVRSQEKSVAVVKSQWIAYENGFNKLANANAHYKKRNGCTLCGFDIRERW